MAVKRPVIEKQEGWRRGEVRAVESQKISLDSLKRSENWERDLDGSMFSSPGFATEFTVGLHRQIANMEDGEDVRWAGDILDDIVNFQYGFQSRQHQHGGAGTKTSTFTRPLSFLGVVFNGTTDQMNFRFRASDISELTNVEIRFREGGGDYFTTTITPSGWADGVWQLEQVLQSAFAISGTPQWDQVVDMHIISTAAVVDAAGVVNLAFDDFFILRPADTVGEPIWDVFGFERVSTPERYVMVASGSEIWSYLGTVGTKRLTSQNANRPVNMIVANDMVLAANGADNIKRWDADDSTFRDLGIPIPPDTIVGTEAGVAGNVVAGTYFFAVTFDMGIHGEGNSVSPAGSSVTIVTGPDRIDYTNIPIGPPGTIRRLIYRTVDGGGAAGALRLDVIINDNTTTTGQSNVADANLGATLVQDGNQPLVGSMLVYANRTLFLAGVAGSESSVFYSDTTRAVNRTIEQWRATNEFRLNPDDGDRITGMIYFRRFIYIFKRRSTWILDPINLGAPVQISTTLGSVGHRCLVDGGSVLYAWSDEHGPLEIRGQSIVPIGILESNLEREGPRVGDINGNVPATAATILGSIITNKADFDAGTLTGTSSTEVPNSLTLDRVAVPGITLPQNLCTLAGASQLLTASSSTGTTFVANGHAAKDGVIDEFSQAIILFRVFGAGNSFSAQYTITLDTPRTISKLRIFMQQRTSTGNVIEINALADVKYEAPGGGFVSAGQFFVDDNTPSPRLPAGSFLHELNFTPVQTQRIRIDITWTTSALGSLFIGLTEFEAYEAGFRSSGEWLSGPIDLGQTPSEWGRFNANFLIRPTGGLSFFMRSAANAGLLTSANFEPITPGIAPNVLDIPFNPFMEFKAVFTSSSPDETPQLNDLSILFSSAAANFVQPRFESAGVLFDRRYWLSAVSRDDSNPTLVWKFQQLLKSWSRHPGFNVSSWTRLSEDFFSGSATNGRVYRNVIDANGEILTDYAGNKILCLAQLKDSPLTGQDHTNTVLDAVVVCKNEDGNRKNLVKNSSFENWIEDFSPAAWGYTGNFRDGQRLFMETNPRNITDRASSLRLDWSAPSTAAFVNDIFSGLVVQNNQDLLAFHDMSLKPDKDYILTFDVKRDSRSPMNIFRIQDFRSDGNHQYLRNDGTWGALVDEFLGDNTTITETMGNSLFAFKTNSTDPNHAFYRIQFGYLISTNTLPGTTWLDNVTLFEAPLSVPRFIHVLPVLDGQEDLPERAINITGDAQGKLDVGVIRKGFRIDKALVRNLGFIIRHEEAESGAKILALYAKSTPEEWRQ